MIRGEEKMSDVIQKYISQFPGDVQEKLLEIRRAIEDIIPEATQRISWGMPSYSIGNKFIIHFSVHKAHISLHVGTDTVVFFKNKLTPYSKTKSTIHLKFSDPIPQELMQEMIRYNCKRNLSADNNDES